MEHLKFYLKFQDIKIKEQEVLASSDALNSYLSITVYVSYRLPQPNSVVSALNHDFYALMQNSHYVI
jgi:hypothetical protein